MDIQLSFSLCFPLCQLTCSSFPSSVFYFASFLTIRVDYSRSFRKQQKKSRQFRFDCGHMGIEMPIKCQREDGSYLIVDGHGGGSGGRLRQRSMKNGRRRCQPVRTYKNERLALAYTCQQFRRQSISRSP